MQPPIFASSCLNQYKNMSGWCMSRAAIRVISRVRVRVRVRVRSPSQHYEKTASFIKEEEKFELSNQINKLGFDSSLSASECGNRVMVVVDSSPEARGALDWVLSHMLVLGQRKQSLLRCLRMIWNRKRRSRVVDYCIQYANCMTIAVRRKNRKYGGYLITTKRHKNFWLLA